MRMAPFESSQSKFRMLIQLHVHIEDLFPMVRTRLPPKKLSNNSTVIKVTDTRSHHRFYTQLVLGVCSDTIGTTSTQKIIISI